jgi:hypothetical protein
MIMVLSFIIYSVFFPGIFTTTTSVAKIKHFIFDVHDTIQSLIGNSRFQLYNYTTN